MSRTLLSLCLLVLTAACDRSPSAAVPAERALEPAGTAAAASSGRRIALVAGNGAYSASPLANPPRDAELIARTLEQLGFEVRLQTNGDQRAMKRAIQEFGAALEAAGGDAVGLFYYAGHGVQLGGRNYLIPVGASIERDADVEIEAVSADWVIEQMRFARNRLNFVILDACRNNPFARSFRSADRGLARMDAPAGVLIAYSTAPGDVAADGEGANSPYAEALAQVLREDGLPAELMFKRARDAVRRATGERQTPWESSSLTGDNFYFASAPRAAAGAAAPADGAAAAPLVGPATVPVATAPAVAAPAVAAPAATSPVVAATASTAPVASPAERPPEFMADELCRHAVGEWRLEDEAMPGTVRLDADATGTARVRPDHRAVVLPVQWECDAANRDFVITLGDRDVHKVRIDGEEKLMFGYDREGRPLSYVR